MRGRCRYSVSRTFLAVAVIILVQLNLSALNSDKDSYIAFMGNQNPLESAIKKYVAEGNGHMAGSCSDFMLFLKKMEIGERDGVNYNEAQLILNRAVTQMEHARDSYIKFKQKADITDYNPFVIDQLLKFNYNEFQKKKGLIKPIFEEVKSYLIEGKIREMYGKIISHTRGILNIAGSIKGQVYAGEFPEVSKLYELNEACSHALLFGQYVSRIFQEIKLKKR